MQENTWATNKAAAPGIGAVLADSGPLPAGLYDFQIHLVCSDTPAPGRGMVIEHRNAANAATLKDLGGAVPETAVDLYIKNYRLALNERVRIIAGTAAGIAASMYVSAIGTQRTGAE